MRHYPAWNSMNSFPISEMNPSKLSSSYPSHAPKGAVNLPEMVLFCTHRHCTRTSNIYCEEEYPLRGPSYSPVLCDISAYIGNQKTFCGSYGVELLRIENTSGVVKARNRSKHCEIRCTKVVRIFISHLSRGLGQF